MTSTDNIINFIGISMNINKEVEKYEKKKSALVKGLIKKISSFSNYKMACVTQTNKVLKDLEDQKEKDLAEVREAGLVLNKLKKDSEG